LYKELDPDDEELTRTRKVRRGFINEKYANEIGALYSNVEMLPVETKIKYQDGRTATIKTELFFCTMKHDGYYEKMVRKKRWWQREKG